MDYQKLEKIEELVSSIKDKTVLVKSHTNYLKNLNAKLELLIKAFDTYSVVPEVEIIEKKKIPEKKKLENEESKKQKQSEIKLEPVDQRKAISQIFSGNKSNKNTALQIYDLLFESASTGLDEIVKNIKTSKYRVIEILNILVKEKIVLKHFDKGFIYQINKEF